MTLILLFIVVSLMITYVILFNKEPQEVKRFIDQLVLLTTSNLIIWTKTELNSYNHSFTIYKAITEIGTFIIQRNHECHLYPNFLVFDNIRIQAIPFTEPFEINLSKATNVVVMEQYKNLQQLIEYQLKSITNGEIVHE